jgi:hypothetical protein
MLLQWFLEKLDGACGLDSYGSDKGPVANAVMHIVFRKMMDPYWISDRLMATQGFNYMLLVILSVRWLVDWFLSRFTGWLVS